MTQYLLKPGMRSFTFNYWVLLFPALLTAEIFIYRWMKDKYIIRTYANLHIATVIFRMIVFPLLTTVLAVRMITHMSMADAATNGRLYRKILSWTGDIVFIIGHIFFILMIRKRNSRPVQEPASENDYLHEFEG